jgi:hypothetical protein
VKKFLLFLLALTLSSSLGTWLVQSPADASTCAHPRYVTSDPDGMWSRGRYFVHNNMWNASSYRVSQRLSACSPGNWRVVATADNRSGDGAVKSYPNVHRDYHNWSTGHEPRVSSFRTIRSHWAARSPGVGIYNAAYDIWLDGVADGNSKEVMIWTHNRHQVPAGSPVGRVRIGGHAWRVWATSDNSYIAFVPSQKLNHGRVQIRRMLGWLIAKGRLGRAVTLGQIGFGFEIVSTGGRRATFKVDSFGITSRR